MSKRSEKMVRKSNEELKAFIASGSLSAAAAQYELDKRLKDN